MLRQQIQIHESLMNSISSNNPVQSCTTQSLTIRNALKLRVRTSGPISGSTGDVRLSFGDHLAFTDMNSIKNYNTNYNGAIFIT